MNTSFGVQVFCYSCGEGWSEYTIPTNCVGCGKSSQLGYSRSLLNQDDFIGVIESPAQNLMFLEQSVKDHHVTKVFYVPLPLNLYTLDSFIFNWDQAQVYSLDFSFLCSIEFYYKELFGIS